MKKCPYCNAVIEENARFCIYCMKTLNEKQIIKPQKPIKKTVVISIISAVLVFALIVICSFFPNTHNPSFPSINSDSIVNDSSQNFDSSFSEDSSENTENNESQYQTSSSNSNSKNNFTSNTITSNNTTTSNSSSNSSSSNNSSTSSSSTSSSSSNSSSSGNVENSSDQSSGNNSSNNGETETSDLLQALTYQISKNEIEILQCDTELKGDIIIPQEIDGIPVVRITRQAFINCNKITSIVIPESVRQINTEAFKNCTALKRVNIPKNINIIESYIFSNCTSLTDVTLPKLSYIPTGMFYDCTSLTEITLKSEVIMRHVFNGCTNLKTIHITSQFPYLAIQDYAFNNCTSLSDIYFNFDTSKVEFGSNNESIINATWH